jgi:hypothetical protein
MYHEQNLSTSIKAQAIMILRTWRGGSKSRWNPWRERQKQYIMAPRPRRPALLTVAHRTYS